MYLPITHSEKKLSERLPQKPVDVRQAKPRLKAKAI
jgi:hypothetical protein